MLEVITVSTWLLPSQKREPLLNLYRNYLEIALSDLFLKVKFFRMHLLQAVSIAGAFLKKLRHPLRKLNLVTWYYSFLKLAQRVVWSTWEL